MPPRSRRRPGWKSLIGCTRRRSSAVGVIACAEGATASACGGGLARAPSMPIAGVEGRSSKLAALQARVDAILPDTKRAFRFALSRDDEVIELPNPLPPRRAIN